MRVAGRGAINSFPKLGQQRDYRFPKSARLKRKEDFSLVRQLGDICTSKNFTLRQLKRTAGNYLEVPVEMKRLGISFYPRTKSSVVRNRVKRIFREIFRMEKENLVSGIDFLISMKPKESIKEVQFSVLREEFIAACKKVNIWREKDLK